MLVVKIHRADLSPTDFSKSTFSYKMTDNNFQDVTDESVWVGDNAGSTEVFIYSQRGVFIALGQHNASLNILVNESYYPAVNPSSNPFYHSTGTGPNVFESHYWTRSNILASSDSGIKSYAFASWQNIKKALVDGTSPIQVTAVAYDSGTEGYKLTFAVPHKLFVGQTIKVSTPADWTIAGVSQTSLSLNIKAIVSSTELIVRWPFKNIVSLGLTAASNVYLAPLGWTHRQLTYSAVSYEVFEPAESVAGFQHGFAIRTDNQYMANLDPMSGTSPRVYYTEGDIVYTAAVLSNAAATVIVGNKTMVSFSSADQRLTARPISSLLGTCKEGAAIGLGHVGNANNTLITWKMVNINDQYYRYSSGSDLGGYVTENGTNAGNYSTADNSLYIHTKSGAVEAYLASFVTSTSPINEPTKLAFSFDMLYAPAPNGSYGNASLRYNRNVYTADHVFVNVQSLGHFLVTQREYKICE